MGGVKWTKKCSSWLKHMVLGLLSWWWSFWAGSTPSRACSGELLTHGLMASESEPTRFAREQNAIEPKRCLTRQSCVSRTGRGRALRAYLDPESGQTWDDVLPVLAASADDARRRASRGYAILIALLAGAILLSCLVFWPVPDTRVEVPGIARSAIAGPW